MTLKTPALPSISSGGGSFTSGGGKMGVLDGSQLVERMRGKLRRCGVRAQLLLSSTISASASTASDPFIRQPSISGSGTGTASLDLSRKGARGTGSAVTFAEPELAAASASSDLATASSGICPRTGSSMLMSSPSGCGVAWKTAAQSAVDGSGGSGSSGKVTTVLSLHVTPMRCSRPLSLRYLSQHYKVPLSDFTLVAFTAQQPANAAGLSSGGGASAVRSSTLSGPMARQKSVGLGGGLGGVQAAGAGGSGRAMTTMLSSDGEELVGGMQKVVLLGRGHVAVAAGACRFSVDLSPYDPARVSLGGDVEAA